MDDTTEQKPARSPEPPTDPLKVNLDRPKKPHRVRTFFFCIALLIAASIIGFGIYAYQFTKTQITNKNDQKNFFGQVRRIIDSDVEPLRGETEDRINMLFLGQGGLNHPGGTLTDTIMLASIKPSTKQVALLSFPRDLVVPFTLQQKNSTAVEYRKINNAVFFGGVDLAKQKIAEVTGLQVHYSALVDFDGFRDIIDSLGGIDVNVERSFTDYEYPDYNYGYQTISFKVGQQHFDGETSLQYARSRHGNNGEGGDYSRAGRQQIILESVREKLLSASTFLNPTKIASLLNDVGAHVSTDMEIWEMLQFADFAKSIERDHIITHVIDNTENQLVYNDRSDETGASIVVPRAGLGDFTEIQSFAQQIFNQEELVVEDAVVVLQNGSSITGLASSTASALQAQGITIAEQSITNALTKQLETTTIFDLSGGSFPTTLQTLEEYFARTGVSATLPTSGSEVRVATDIDPTRVNVEALPEGVDFIVLIGADAPKTASNNSRTRLY